MSPVDPRQCDLVAGWWEFQRLSAGDRAARKVLEVGEPAEVVAAWQAVDEQIHEGGLSAVDLVAALVDAAPDEDALAQVGAGPLEDLLVRHGPTLLDEVERRARQDPRFHSALSAVWWSRRDAGR